jgi:hypothetical protein
MSVFLLIKDNIKMDLRDRIGTSEHGKEPSGSMKCWEILE